MAWSVFAALTTGTERVALDRRRPALVDRRELRVQLHETSLGARRDDGDRRRLRRREVDPDIGQLVEQRRGLLLPRLLRLERT